MARIKYSGLIDEINGSIGGTTFQRNRYGFTIKRKPAGRKSGSLSQLARRNALYGVQQAWIGLIDSERAAWNTYASTFPAATRLNPNVFLNGVNLFERYHLLRSLFDSTILANPSGVQQTLSFGTFITEIQAPNFNVTSNVTISGASWAYLLFLSRPLRATTQLSKSKTRFITAQSVGASFSGDVDGPYIALFGSIPVATDFVQFRRVYLNQANGQIFDSGIQQSEVD
jgi:hypothetical protein